MLVEDEGGEMMPDMSNILFFLCSSNLPPPLPTHPHPILLSNPSMSVFPDGL